MNVYTGAVDPAQTETPQEAAPKPPKRSRRAKYVCVLAGLLLVYLLSVGPSFKAMGPNPSHGLQQAVLAIYSPVILIAFQFEFARGIFIWYVSEVWKVPSTAWN